MSAFMLSEFFFFSASSTWVSGFLQDSCWNLFQICVRLFHKSAVSILFPIAFLLPLDLSCFPSFSFSSESALSPFILSPYLLLTLYNSKPWCSVYAWEFLPSFSASLPSSLLSSFCLRHWLNILAWTLIIVNRQPCLSDTWTNVHRVCLTLMTPLLLLSLFHLHKY